MNAEVGSVCLPQVLFFGHYISLHHFQQDTYTSRKNTVHLVTKYDLFIG